MVSGREGWQMPGFHYYSFVLTKECLLQIMPNNANASPNPVPHRLLNILEHPHRMESPVDTKQSRGDSDSAGSPGGSLAVQRAVRDLVLWLGFLIDISIP